MEKKIERHSLKLDTVVQVRFRRSDYLRIKKRALKSGVRISQYIRLTTLSSLHYDPPSTLHLAVRR